MGLFFAPEGDGVGASIVIFQTSFISPPVKTFNTPIPKYLHSKHPMKSAHSVLFPFLIVCARVSHSVGEKKRDLAKLSVPGGGGHIDVDRVAKLSNNDSQVFHSIATLIRTRRPNRCRRGLQLWHQCYWMRCICACLTSVCGDGERY